MFHGLPTVGDYRNTPHHGPYVESEIPLSLIWLAESVECGICGDPLGYTTIYLDEEWCEGGTHPVHLHCWHNRYRGQKWYEKLRADAVR